MNNQANPTPAATQKSRRKAAAADANDRTIFQRTEFGRRRVPSYPVRFMLAFFGMVAAPFALVYCTFRAPKSPLERNDRGTGFKTHLNE